MAKTLEDKEEKKGSRFQMFISIIFIPILFAVAVTLIILTVAGINVFDSTKEISKKIPFISSYLEAEETATPEETEAKIIDLQGGIQDREAKLEQLEKQMQSKEEELSQSAAEKEQLQQQIDELLAIQEENKKAFKEIIATYEQMSAKKAAPIIENLNDSEALKIMSSMKPDTLASIMENLEPENAARYTELLTNETEGAAIGGQN